MNSLGVALGNEAVLSLILSALVAAAVWCLCAGLPKISAATRFMLWSLVLYAAVLVPAGHLGYLKLTALNAAPVTPAIRTGSPIRGASGDAAIRALPPEKKASTVPAVPKVAPTVAAVTLPQYTLPARAALLLAYGWCIIAALLLLRVLFSYGALRRIRSRAYAPDIQVLESFRATCKKLGVSNDVQLMISADIGGPVSLGFIHPVVLMPEEVCRTFPPAEIEQIILHECAHIKRRDMWNGLLAQITLALAFFNPFIWSALRRLEIEREVACDDWVALHTVDVRGYAVALTKISQSMAGLPVLSMGWTGSPLVQRVELLLEGRRARSASPYAANAIRMVFSVAAIGVLVAFPSVFGTAGAATTASESVDGSFEQVLKPDHAVHVYAYEGSVIVHRGNDKASRVRAHAGSNANVYLRGGVQDGELIVCALPKTPLSENPGHPLSQTESPCAAWGDFTTAQTTPVVYEITVPIGINVVVETIHASVRGDVPGDAILRTVSGDIDIAALGTLRALSDTGNISGAFSAIGARDTPAVRTKQGNVSLRLPRGINAEVVATSFGGTIKASFPITLSSEREYNATVGRAMLGNAGKKLIVEAGKDIMLSQP